MKKCFKVIGLLVLAMIAFTSCEMGFTTPQNDPHMESVFNVNTYTNGVSIDHPNGYYDVISSGNICIKSTEAYEGPIRWAGYLELDNYPMFHSKTRDVILRFYSFNPSMNGFSSTDCEFENTQIIAPIKYIKDYTSYCEISFTEDQAEEIYKTLKSISAKGKKWGILLIDNNNPRSEAIIYTAIHSMMHLTDMSLWNSMVAEFSNSGVVDFEDGMPIYEVSPLMTLSMGHEEPNKINESLTSISLRSTPSSFIIKFIDNVYPDLLTVENTQINIGPKTIYSNDFEMNQPNIITIKNKEVINKIYENGKNLKNISISIEGTSVIINGVYYPEVSINPYIPGDPMLNEFKDLDRGRNFKPKFSCALDKIIDSESKSYGSYVNHIPELSGELDLFYDGASGDYHGTVSSDRIYKKASFECMQLTVNTATGTVISNSSTTRNMGEKCEKIPTGVCLDFGNRVASTVYSLVRSDENTRLEDIKTIPVYTISDTENYVNHEVFISTTLRETLDKNTYDLVIRNIQNYLEGR